MIRRYRINYTGEHIIFTTGNKNIEKFPNVLTHLKKFEKKLKERHDYKRAANTKSHFQWWRLSNLRNLQYLKSKNDKLFVPMIAPENRFVFVKKDSFICTADVYVLIPQDKKFNLRYIQGILNSRLMNLVVKNNAKAVDGSAKTADGTTQPRFSYAVRYLENIPIKNATIKQQNDMAEMVVEIEYEYKQLEKNKIGKERIQKNIDMLDSQINQLTLEIYGISEKDMNDLM